MDILPEPRANASLPATNCVEMYEPGGSVVLVTAEEEQHLWKCWRDRSEVAARQLLIRKYMDFARMLAASTYSKRTHEEIGFGDYFQLACVGMIEAVDRFNPDHGVQFKTFASKRVIGAILNGLEPLTEKSQQIAAKQRIQKERLAQLKIDTGIRTNDEGVEYSLHQKDAPRSSTELLRYLADLGMGVALGVLLEESGMFIQEGQAAASEYSPDVQYFRQDELRRLRLLVKDVVGSLSDQQQFVIRHHYLQDIAFEKIACELDVTRGRVSQLHRQALAQLRTLLNSGDRSDRYI